MPFISNLSYYNADLDSTPLLGSLGVERLQLVSCDDIITLQANPENSIVGHTVGWVQMTGTVVTWLTPQDDLDATFQQTLVRDDKIFRFYVDQGTPIERYEDILVTAIPTEYTPSIPPAVYPVSRFWATEEEAQSIRLFPGPSPDGTVTEDNTGLMLGWQNPGPRVYRGSKVRRRNLATGLWDIIQVGDFGLSYASGLQIGRSYRVDLVLRQPIATQDRPDSESTTLSQVPVAGYKTLDTQESMTLIGPSAAAAPAILEVLSRQIVGTEVPEEDLPMVPGFTYPTPSVLEVLTRELLATEVPQEASPSIPPVFGHSFLILEIKTLGITSLG